MHIWLDDDTPLRTFYYHYSKLEKDVKEAETKQNMTPTGRR